MKALISPKAGIALLLCCTFLALSACQIPGSNSTASSSSDINAQSGVADGDGTAADSTYEQAGNSTASKPNSVETSSSAKNASSKNNSSKSTGTASKPTVSQATVIKPEEETVTKPETLPEAEKVEKPVDIQPVITDLSPIQADAFYGRAMLAKRQNAEALLAAYDRIVAGVEKGDESINLKDSKNPIKVDEFLEVISYYLNDYPHHFWLGKNISYSRDKDTNVVYSFTPEYIIDAKNLKQAKSDWNAAAKEILKGISGSASEYDREKLIHDRLAEKVTYDISAANGHTAYGALVEGRAVCEGYARAFQYLCYQAGMQCLIVSGTSTNPDTGKQESHAWNVIQIDNEYYHLDLTWDDQDSTLFYAYFNLTDEMIESEHTLDEYNYPLPACTATVANYFVKNGSFLGGDYTVEQVGKLMKAGGGTARLYVDDTERFWEWFKANSVAICKILGLKGKYGYGYSSLGNETIPWMKLK